MVNEVKNVEKIVRETAKLIADKCKESVMNDQIPYLMKLGLGQLVESTADEAVKKIIEGYHTSEKPEGEKKHRGRPKKEAPTEVVAISTSSPRSRYTDEFKDQIINEFLDTDATLETLYKKYQIKGHGTIQNWMTTYIKNHPAKAKSARIRKAMAIKISGRGRRKAY